MGSKKDPRGFRTTTLYVDADDETGSEDWRVLLYNIASLPDPWDFPKSRAVFAYSPIPT